jgi:glycosyltransferase involved in cell wall biosynthesis
MRIGVASVQVPFIHGGAEDHTNGLINALREASHKVELITMPYRFGPVSEVRRSMDIWANEDFDLINGFRMDVVICLKFPTYYLKHSNKVVWLLHQNRDVYELWGTPFTEELSKSEEGAVLKREITQRDTQSLSLCQKVFANSERISARLKHFNGIDSIPLYHPPKLAPLFYTSNVEPYIFFPSRLEDLKRQYLIIEAMKHVRNPVVALLAGEGGKKEELQNMINEMDLCNRVKLIGYVSNEELLAYYAHCLGVFFGPYDEDYGYVTLEAMLAAKPVITCTDSGGPLEFVLNRETGFVVEPEPELIAGAIDSFYLNKNYAARMGKAGYRRYQELKISWDNVLLKLL